MNIGITCYPTYGGSGIIATELGQHLARRGHEVHFITSDRPNRLVESSERVFFHEVEPMNYPVFEYVPYDLALAAKMLEVAQSNHLDLLHVHYAIPHAISGYLAREMLETRYLPVVTTLHGTDITLVGRDHSYLPVTRFGIRKSDGVSAVSRFLQQATLKEFCPHCEIQIIPNFVDTVKVCRRDCREGRRRYAANGERVIIHVSNFRPVKRIGDVIQIFQRIQKVVPAVLLMIGDGAEHSSAQQLASALGLSDSVFFLGMVGNVEHYLSMADLMLLPSQTESFGLAALEALACQVPVVASRTGGLPELVIEGECGRLFPVGDVDAMARGALEMLEPDRLAEYRVAARRRAETEFSADRIILMYEEFYHQILTRHASAGTRV